MKKVAKYIAIAALLNGSVGLAQNTDTELKTYSVGARLVHLYDLPSYRFDSDLNEDLKGLSGKNTKLDFGLDLYGEKQFTPLWGIQAGIRVGGLTGANEVEYFKNSFTEGYGDILFYLSNIDKRRMETRWNYYLKTGLGAGGYKAERFLVEDDSPNGETKSNFWEARFGAGVQYELNSQLRIELDFAYNAAFSDGFDGYNGSTGSDPYLSTGIGVAYTFGNRDAKPMYAVNFFSEDYFGANGQNNPAMQQEKQKKDSATAAELAAANQQIEQMNEKLEKQDEAIALLEKRMAETLALAEAAVAIAAEPKVVATVEGDMIAAPTGVEHELFFEFDSYKLSAEAKQVLKSNLTGKEGSVVLTGYADAQGDSRYNQILKRKRAEEVKRFLVKEMGYDPDVVRTLAADRTVDLSEDDSLNRKVVVQAQ